MTIEKGLILCAKVGAISFALLIAGVPSAYWWTNTIPQRPANMDSRAVWLWSPSVGLPAPRRGVWVTCWMDATFHCRITDKEGRRLHEGVFLSYPEMNSALQGQLELDADRTQKDYPDRALFIGKEFVPMVHLKAGGVLIPQEKYEQGKHMLDTLRQSR